MGWVLGGKHHVSSIPIGILPWNTYCYFENKTAPWIRGRGCILSGGALSLEQCYHEVTA